MRNVPVNLRQNIQIGQPPPQNCFGYCPECPNLFDCGTPQLLKKYMRRRKDGKHAKGLNLSNLWATFFLSISTEKKKSSK